MQIIVDTSVLIDYLRGFRQAKLGIDELKENESLGTISVITEAEILSGKDCAAEGKRMKALELLQLFRKIDVSSDIAQKAAEFRRNHGVALDDCIIAATAFREKCTIWTKNAEDFRRIKEIEVKDPY